MYKHWRQTFYRGVIGRRWLEHYASRFMTVELNSSFYRVPNVSSVMAWQDATPPSFDFSAKVWRAVTHYRKLRGCRDLLERFAEPMAAFHPTRRAALLVQLPASFRTDVPRLDDFLHVMRDVIAGWRVAVEVRDRSWLHASLLACLRRHDAALCVHDSQPCGVSRPASCSSFIYVRRHRGAVGTGGYSPDQVANDARMLSDAKRDGWLYYNNDWDEHAVRDAAALVDAMHAS
jgi:uncharacterized protein YecE (DUF72 family)